MPSSSVSASLAVQKVLNDAAAVKKKLGRPTLYVTFTENGVRQTPMHGKPP